MIFDFGFGMFDFGFFASLKRKFRMFDPIAIGFGFIFLISDFGIFRCAQEVVSTFRDCFLMDCSFGQGIREASRYFQRCSRGLSPFRDCLMCGRADLCKDVRMYG